MEVFIITPFPNTINVLIENNIANQGIKKKLLNVEVVNLRDFTNDNYKKIDDTINFKDYDKTVKYCHSTVGIAILNTSITIVFGFSILILSNFIPTIYFGVFTGIAMLLAMVSVLTLLPSLLLLFKPFKIK